jgi:hypothetical protein
MWWLGLVILFSALNNTHSSLCGKTRLCPLLHVRHRTRVTTTNKTHYRCLKMLQATYLYKRVFILAGLSSACWMGRHDAQGRTTARACVCVTFYELYYVFRVPITVAARSEAWTVFTRSNAGIVGSNPTQRMDVCVRFFCVCVVLCR